MSAGISGNLLPWLGRRGFPMNPANGDFTAALTPLPALGCYGKVGEVAALRGLSRYRENAFIRSASFTGDGGFKALGLQALSWPLLALLLAFEHGYR